VTLQITAKLLVKLMSQCKLHTYDKVVAVAYDTGSREIGSNVVLGTSATNSQSESSRKTICL